MSTSSVKSAEPQNWVHMRSTLVQHIRGRFQRHSVSHPWGIGLGLSQTSTLCLVNSPLFKKAGRSVCCQTPKEPCLRKMMLAAKRQTTMLPACRHRATYIYAQILPQCLSEGGLQSKFVWLPLLLYDGRRCHSNAGSRR